MYQKFNATTIDIDRIRKSVHIDFSYDVDEDTINSKTVYVYKNKNGDIVSTQCIVEGTSVNLSFTNDMEPNTEYVIVVTKEVASITGENVYTAVKKTFTVDSSVTSRVAINSPSNYEELADKVALSWNEIAGDDNKTCETFLVQIASDNLFFNVLLESEVNNKTSVTFGTVKDAEQYFVRVRAQKSQEDFGAWSDIITFTLIKTATNKNDDEAIFQKAMEVLTIPEQGQTPESFIIEFDAEIDVSSVEDSIILIRKPV